jgi:hypothetical protein
MDQIETIGQKNQPLAYIIRAQTSPEKTTFVTPSDLGLQMGFVVYPAGGEITRHAHLPLERHVVGTGEVLVVRKGRCEVDIYDYDRALVATRELHTGDVLLLVGGGHAFRMSADTVFLEIKQGPYAGPHEKERY